jgi:hypothetical protein
MTRNHPAGLRAAHDAAPFMAALDDAWTLLEQAPEHQMALLVPSHPGREDMGGLRNWIQDCVTSIHKAQALETLTAHSDERAHLQEVAARIAAVVDAFHIYASMLERFRNNAEPAPGELPSARSLTALAEDEKVLLTCRAAVRKSMQQLYTAL